MAFKMKDTTLYKRTPSKNGSTFMHTAKFGSNTTMGEMEAVKKHNKRHQGGETHAPGKYPTGKYKDSVINKGEWSAKKEGGEGGPKKYKKAKPATKKHHAMKKHEPAHKKHHAMKKHKPAHKKVGDAGKADKFTEGTIPSHVKKAFPNLTQAEFDKDKQGYNKKALAKLKAGDKPMTKYGKGPKKYKK